MERITLEMLKEDFAKVQESVRKLQALLDEPLFSVKVPVPCECDHEHKFEWTLAPAEDGSNYECCVANDECTAIRIHGEVRNVEL